MSGAHGHVEGDNKKNVRIRSFDDTLSLDVYLREINISELQHLL